MSNKEKHICTDCIHDDVCEWAVSNENKFICGSFIDKKVLERPQGEWQLHGMIYYCSECGHECGESGDNFCGNCGADMRGGRE